MMLHRLIKENQASRWSGPDAGDLTHLVEVDDLQIKGRGVAGAINNGMTDRLLSWPENLFLTKFSN